MTDGRLELATLANKSSTLPLGHVFIHKRQCNCLKINFMPWQKWKVIIFLLKHSSLKKKTQHFSHHHWKNPLFCGRARSKNCIKRNKELYINITIESQLFLLSYSHISPVCACLSFPLTIWVISGTYQSHVYINSYELYIIFIWNIRR